MDVTLPETNRTSHLKMGAWKTTSWLVGMAQPGRWELLVSGSVSRQDGESNHRPSFQMPEDFDKPFDAQKKTYQTTSGHGWKRREFDRWATWGWDKIIDIATDWNLECDPHARPPPNPGSTCPTAWMPGGWFYISFEAFLGCFWRPLHNILPFECKLRMRRQLGIKHFYSWRPLRGFRVFFPELRMRPLSMLN